MDGNSHTFDGVRRSLFEGRTPARRVEPPAESETEELSCSAFNYLRGMHERAPSLEFRFRTGNRLWLPYSLLAACRYDPSVGVLMKYTGDVVTLILLRGSNLDLPVQPGGVDLIERGTGWRRGG